MMRNFSRFLLIIALLAMGIVPAAAQVNCSSRIDHMAVGQEALVGGDYATAIENFDCTIDGIGQSIDAYVGRSLARMLSGDLSGGIDDAVVIFETGGERAITSAIRQYDSIIGEGATGSAYAARGLLEWLLGADGNAVVLDMSDAISMGEDSPVVYLIRGATSLTYGIGDVDEAFSDIEKALDQEPDDAYIYYVVGNAYAGLEQTDEALENYNRALELNPDLNEAYSALGFLYMQIEDYEQAIETFDQYLGMTPTEEEQPDVYFNIGFAHDKLGESLPASQSFSQYLTVAGFEFLDAETIEINDPQTVEMTYGWVYQFTLSLTEGQVVDLSASSTLPGLVDPLLVVLGPDGSGVTANDDRSETVFDSLVQNFEAPETGTYTILVSHAFGGSEGDIDVEVIVNAMDV